MVIGKKCKNISRDEAKSVILGYTCLNDVTERFMQGMDGVATLPATGEAPADLTWTGDPTFCTIWSLCGVPAVAIPTGLGPHSLPLGLQIVGPRFADDRTLSVARWCDERVGRSQRVVT